MKQECQPLGHIIRFAYTQLASDDYESDLDCKPWKGCRILELGI
jgi:hypothetical protein